MTKVKTGETYTLHDSRDGDAEHTVKEPCGSKTGGRWYCATHSLGFDTPLSLDCHLADDRDHVIGWWCFEHGLEQP